jgi:hypothetical protein
MSTEETAVCRGCGKQLVGPPYYMGKRAGQSVYDPVTKEDAKVNFYGGYVCSEACDYRASLELEQSMPGHGYSQKSISGTTLAHHKQNWAHKKNNQ